MAYGSNEIVKAICDHMAERDNNQNETTVHRIINHLNKDSLFDYKRKDVIAAFHELEKADCGKYIKGWGSNSKSRFAWSVRSKLIAGAAQGEEEEDDVWEEENFDDLEEPRTRRLSILTCFEKA